MAATLAFPGSLKSVQKEIAADFIKRTLVRLCKIAHSTADLTATIMLDLTKKTKDANGIKTSRTQSKVIFNVDYKLFSFYCIIN